MNSRLRYSDLHNMPAHPIILPKHHEVTKKFVLFCHKKVGHATLATTMYIVRQRVFIPSNRSAIRNFLHGCSCRQLLKLENSVQMHPLPRCRIERARLFLWCSIDAFGPMFIFGRGYSGKAADAPPTKVFGVMITCYTTRFIYAIPVIGCTTDAILHVIRRCGALFNHPQKIFSDNAMNFLKASKDLKKLLKDVDWERIRK